MHSNGYEFAVIQDIIDRHMDKCLFSHRDEHGVSELAESIVNEFHSEGYRLTSDAGVSFDD